MSRLDALTIDEFLRAKPRHRFILLRHGQTQCNAQRRLQGQKDSPLSGQGLREVEHENRRMYFFFPATRELWSCLVSDGLPAFERGHVTGAGLGV